jgi:TolB-like protein
MSLFNELKRRNVFRVAIAYLALSWLLIEVSGTLFPAFGIPDWGFRFVVILFAIGFVPTLIISWAYELTPEGLKRDRDLVRDTPSAHGSAKRLDGITIVLILVALGFILADRFWLSPRLAQPSAIPVEAPSENSQSAELELAIQRTPPNSIAVLPFVNMSSDPEQEYFSDGVTEEILNVLAQVKELRVAGRTSSFAFKGQQKDLREIGDILGVSHILEGSVRKSGNTVRITAQLIQVDDGFHIWSESYDRELTDIFAIQDQIAVAILGQLKTELLKEDSDQAMTNLLTGDSGLITSARTQSEAYDLYLLAKQSLHQRNQPAIELASDLLKEAITIDPDYAPAHAQLGIATILLSETLLGTLPELEAEETGRSHLEKALQLDPDLPEAMAGLGLYFKEKGIAQLDTAVVWLRRALAANPNLAEASAWLASSLSTRGQIREPLEIATRLFARDPLYKPGFATLIRLYILTGQSEKALGVLSDLEPFLQDDSRWLLHKGFVQLFNGQWAESNHNLRAALARSPTDSQAEHWLSQLLTETAQYEDCLKLGVGYICTLSLNRLGRPEDARKVGEKAVEDGRYPCWFFWALLENGDHAFLVDFVESHWDNLESFERDFQDNAGWGSHAMTSIADAYAKLGQHEKFSKALERARASNNAQIEQGANNPWLHFTSAHIAVLSGNDESAIDYLERGALQGGPLDLSSPTSWPAFRGLEGNPRYDKFKTRMLEKLSAEREKMGLEPWPLN